MAVAFQKGLGCGAFAGASAFFVADTHHGWPIVNIPYGMEFNVKGFEHNSNA